ncbi:MAG: hypothetical protein JRI68_17775, partial [Deltaproteobacteria bacterium]|nr:hypothetical protein [Deltaproteobacteria bacterium]
GTVWGGSASLGCQLDEALSAHGASGSSPRLKYVLIPTCYNLSDEAHRLWIPALHRSNPVHGVFGYSKAYPGGQTGRGIFTRFAQNLRKNGGRTPILEAFKKAHTGYLAKRWGAVMHASAMGDTMRDWLAGKLPTPSPTGELRWFCHDTWPSGAPVRTDPPPYQVSYVIDGKKITRGNRNWSDTGLFPGAEGHLEIRKASGTIDPTETLEILFHYYRPEKSGMDLDKLLQIGTTTDAVVTPGRDLNKLDSTSHVDGLEVRAARPGLSAIEIPFTVHPEVRQNYHGDAYFWMKLRAGASTECAYYFEGAWLRGPIP